MSVWLLGLAAGTALIVGAAGLGWWFGPFLVGALAGLANRIGAWSVRVALPAVIAMAVVGWGAPLAWAALHGEPYRALARVIAAIAGLPASASVGFGLTLLVAAAQVVAGYWLGRALSMIA